MKYERNRAKEKFIHVFPEEYIALSVQSTGFDHNVNDIIEVAVIKCSGDKVTDSFSSLVKPAKKNHDGSYVIPFITNMTGITNEMLTIAPELSEVAQKLKNIIGSNIIVTFKVSYQLPFVRDAYSKCLDCQFENEYVNLQSYAKKLLPDLESHSLYTLAEHLHIPYDPSKKRAADTAAVYVQLLSKLKETAIEKYGSTEAFFENYYKKSVNPNTLTPQSDTFDEEHPLFGKLVTITGKLPYGYTKQDTYQYLIDVGGKYTAGFRQDVNVLVEGSLDGVSNVSENTTDKMKKAMAMHEKGKDIVIISGKTYLEMLGLI
ncbi:MAG: exonuclease domain-containing protein [Oscillospiraceae bacterium]